LLQCLFPAKRQLALIAGKIFCRIEFAAIYKGQGGHGLPFSAISCRFSPSTQSVWLFHRVGITFAVVGMRSRRFGVLSTN
jgi:hypothetical protein